MAAFTDARAGLLLTPFADDESVREYISFVGRMCSRIRRKIRTTVDATIYWAEDDWPLITESAERLRDDLTKQEYNLGFDVKAMRRDLTDVIDAANHMGLTVPYQTFFSAFHRGDVHEKVRPMLDWENLEQAIETDEVSIEIRRKWAASWFETTRAKSVWCINSNSDFCHFYEPDAQNIDFTQINVHFKSLPEASRAAIRLIGQTFNFRSSRSGLHCVEIVTYQIGEHEVLVLDGNHRMSAVARGVDGTDGPLAVQIVEFRIIPTPGVAPLLPELLPKSDQKPFYDVIREVKSKMPTATPNAVWREWHERKAAGTSR